DVVAAQPLAELDAVEDLELGPQTDVLGAQIAVTFANASLARAAPKQRYVPRDVGLRETLERREPRFRDRVAGERRALGQVGTHGPRDHRRQAVRISTLGHSRVKVGELGGYLVELGTPRGALRQSLVQHLVRWQPPHHHKAVLGGAAEIADLAEL